MTNPKQAAKELIEKFMSHAYGDAKAIREHNAKACAIICVDEILDFIKDGFIPNAIAIMSNNDPGYKFWKEVKEQIKKL